MQTALQTRQDERYTELSLQPGTVDIGQAAGNHLCLDDPDISMYHARIVTYFHESILLDLSSEKGTFLNGERIIKHSLREDDVIQLGNHHFIVKIPRE